MKIAVSGKGGVGKTTVAGTMARILARRGFRVLAIDADPNTNLALTLGIPLSEAEKVAPISDNADLIERKTGVRPESYGGVFRLSFRVDDIVERFCLRGPEGVGLLVVGTVRAGGQGCMCPANALVRSLLRYLLTRRDEVVVVDMEAGIEHLGRGTARHVDAMLVVVEPSVKSLETAKRVDRLATELGVERVLVVGNKVTTPSDRRMIERFCHESGIPLLAMIPYDEAIREADAQGRAPIDDAPDSPGMASIREICDALIV
ncbi:MAG: P-loop NTPase [Candidatus Bathyarchaeia archaeon]